MNTIENLFPKDEMIKLMKSHNFKLTNSSMLDDFYYYKSLNPFDKIDFVSLEFNNNLLIKIDKKSNIYVVRIGKDTGWTGGLQSGDTEYSFDIINLNFNEFKKGFLNAIDKQEYCLVSKWGTGNIKKVIFKGTIQEIKTFAIKNNYEIKKLNSNFIDFYCYNHELPSFDNNKHLQIYVLSSIQYNNLK